MGLTPMMLQYLQIHEEVPDAILFFRLGDFYEMFFDDAKEVSKELGLTLTGKDCGLDERAPMCGIPYHSADSYIAKLIENGHKVAICEQTEDPALTKGLVKREIVRMISPGTMTDSTALDPGSNNYLMAILMLQEKKDNFSCAFALLDLSCADFRICEYHGEDASEWLISQIAKFKPAEILLHTSLFEKNIFYNAVQAQSTAVIQPWPAQKFQKSICEAKIKEHFGIYALSSLGLEDHAGAVRAAGALLSYIEDEQHTDTSHIGRLQILNDQDVMAIDAASRSNLELTRTIRSAKKTGSLLSVLDQSASAAGSRMLKNWIESPLKSTEKILARQRRVRELYENLSLLESLRQDLSDLYDMERICSKIVTIGATPNDLISLKQSIAAVRHICEQIQESDLVALKADYEELDLLEDIYALIDESIYESEHSQKRIADEQKIKTGYNPELDEIRDLSQNGKNYLLQIEQKEKERTGISTLKVKYNKVFGYFIEVSNSKKDLVPEDYIRKQTLANSERFFTPELKETETKITQAETRLTELESVLFKRILDQIKEAVPRILHTAKVNAELDVYAALAKCAHDYDYVCPTIQESGGIQIQGGRHPVVEQRTGRAHFISNDTSLNDQDFMVLLTGPNMAGKSTYIRQTALIVLMAQIGSFVPADSASIEVCDRIFTRVGASDDIATGQSTFMVEMTEVSNILRNATAKSLVILDEIGRGTSTFDGISIAWAICENLLSRNVKTLFATHYHELTELEELKKGICNYSIAVKETGSGVLFLRKIRRGAADQSYGIEVAKLAGFPKEVTDRAEEILSQLESTQIQDLPRSIPVDKSTQISFFTPVEPQGSSEQHISDRLKKINPNDLTPRAALDLIYDLYDLVKENES